MNKRSLDGGDESATKRQRLASPSKVLHLRGLPAGAAEYELRNLLSPFGTVEKIMVLANQQAFVQMGSIVEAAKILETLSAHPLQLRGSPVQMQFSHHAELRASESKGAGGPGGADGLGQPPNSILLVTVHNTRIPVTLEHLHQIFSPFGPVLRIVTFSQNNIFKALVQMATVQAAVDARSTLDGRDIFEGCCHLRIGFSNLTTVTVKEDNAKQRDFTRAAPSSSGVLGTGYGAPYGFPGAGGMMPGMIPTPMGVGMPSEASGGPGCVLLVNNLPTSSTEVTPDMLYTLFGAYGDVMRVKILFNKRESAMVQFGNAQQATLALSHLNHVPFFENELMITVSKNPFVQLSRSDDAEGAKLNKDYSNSRRHRQSARHAKNVFAPSRVLHVAGLPEGATEAQLRQLFADAIPTKDPAPVTQFFSTDRKMALVAVPTLRDAVIAMVRLHDTPMGERRLRVSFSNKDPSALKNSDSPSETAGEGAATA